MEKLTGRVAVITGGASGIGFGMAHAFATAGMRIVLVDVEPMALSEAANTLVSRGAAVVAECVDVRDADALEDLADHAYSAFGEVNVVCNNAGVIEDNLPTWEYTSDDWDWVLGVNLMGVVNGISAFVPRMLDAGTPGHIVNTASFGGLISGTANPIYTVSKHAVVALSENLQNDFTARDAALKVSVLCPGWVRSAIVDSDRNRTGAPPLNEAMTRTRERFQQGVESGLDGEEVGEMVVEALRDERFYIHTHPQWLGLVRDRFDAIMETQTPARTRIPNPKK